LITFPSPLVTLKKDNVEHEHKSINRFQVTVDENWKSEPIMGKRGPECMRKCIAQGVLHPIQCHSLC